MSTAVRIFLFMTSLRVSFINFFFMNIRRPPRSTLFSLHDALPISYPASATPMTAMTVSTARNVNAFFMNDGDGGPRSEEHTSELQSQSNLVCRLLLEKKNTKHHR